MVAAYVNTFNQMRVVLGIFDDKDTARQVFLDLGCEERTRTWKEKTHTDLVITKKFCEYMNERNLPFYSTGAAFEEECYNISFKEVKLNKIEFGYDDD